MNDDFRDLLRALLELASGLARSERERADRAGYARHPDHGTADAVWEKAAAWPED